MLASHLNERTFLFTQQNTGKKLMILALSMSLIVAVEMILQLLSNPSKLSQHILVGYT